MFVGLLTHEKILICLIFPHFSAIFAQFNIFWNAHRPCQQCPNSVNKGLYHVYSFVPHFHSTLQCPPYSCQTPVIPVESSSGIQWSLAEWNQIPVNSTGVQTEIETELECGSKYMYTDSCKYKYSSIYTDFCGVSVISCCLSVSLTPTGNAHSFFWQTVPQYNNCGPISQFSKCVEIMLFDVVFIEKKATDKNVAVKKISYVICSQWEDFKHNSNWFGKLQSKATTFVFPFLEIWHVINLPTTHCMDPDTQNHHDIVFLNFLVIHFFQIFWLQCLSYCIWKYVQTM